MCFFRQGAGWAFRFSVTPDMNEVYSESYRIRSYETDFRGRIRLVTLLNYMQDAASLHASSLGFSVEDLRHKNATWMLSRYRILIFNYPKFGENVRIRTWRSSVEGLYARREFEIFGAGDVQVGAATSSWVILNLTTRRPLRVEAVVGEFPCVARRALPDDFSPLPKMETCTMELPFQVRMEDLDVNRHVNHAVYAGWALETIPAGLLMDCLPFEIEVYYRTEAMFGDRILSRSAVIDSSDSTVFLHQLVRDDDGRELTRLKTTWRTPR